MNFNCFCALRQSIEYPTGFSSTVYMLCQWNTASNVGQKQCFFCLKISSMNFNCFCVLTQSIEYPTGFSSTVYTLCQRNRASNVEQRHCFLCFKNFWYKFGRFSDQIPPHIHNSIGHVFELLALSLRQWVKTVNHIVQRLFGYSLHVWPMK